ncbi:unnamed protein product, partial [Rotaria sp. Silwood1]
MNDFPYWLQQYKITQSNTIKKNVGIRR